MKLKFAKIVVLEKIENRRKYLLISLLSFPFIGLILQPEPSSFLTYVIVGLFAVNMTIILLYRALVKRYKIVGHILMSNSTIQLSDKKYPISDFKEILIFYNGFKGESFPLAQFGVSSLGSKDGAENKMLLKLKNSDDLELNFLSTRKTDLVNLKQILQYYFDNGIDAKIKRV